MAATEGRLKLGGGWSYTEPKLKLLCELSGGSHRGRILVPRIRHYLIFENEDGTWDYYHLHWRAPTVPKKSETKLCASYKYSQTIPADDPVVAAHLEARERDG